MPAKRIRVVKMKRVSQCTWNRDLWGIVNGSGDPWTYRVWGSKADAQEYLDAQKKLPGWHTMAHQVKPISITVRVVAAAK